MTDYSEVKKYLEQIFPRFDADLRELIAEKASLRHFEAGTVLMHKGQYIRSVMLVAEGHVKLYRESEDDGSEFFVYYLEPGDACALSLVCATRQETSEVTAKAMEATTVIALPISMMDDLMRQNKSWYYFALETYRNRFEELLEVVDNIAFKSMDERLEFYLKKQVAELGSQQLRITHQEIANDLNSSREVISRLLKKMEHSGKVQLNKNYIEWLA
jgi:CRP/FNR family transcriptional regulator